MSIRITNEVFINRVKNKFKNLEVVGNYQTAKTGVKLRCIVHDYEFEITPDSLSRSTHGCPLCARENSTLKQRRTNDEFLKLLNTISPTVQPLENYHIATEKISVQCKKCGHVWKSTPDSLLHGNACKKCAMAYVAKLRLKTHDQFISDVNERNPRAKFFDVISRYEKEDAPITCRCKLCNRVWTSSAHSIVKSSGTGCPYCNTSKGEIQILNYLEKNEFDFQWHKEFDDLFGLGGGKLSYDFYLPNKNLLIEYQGNYHDGTAAAQSKAQFEYQQEHDRRKREYAKNHGIELLEIWYKDFNNIDLILDQKLS